MAETARSLVARGCHVVWRTRDTRHPRAVRRLPDRLGPVLATITAALGSDVDELIIVVNEILTATNTRTVRSRCNRSAGGPRRHMLAAGWKVRALTRSPDKTVAQALAAKGIEWRRLDDAASLDAPAERTPCQRAALWQGGVEGDERRQALADAARGGVEH